MNSTEAFNQRIAAETAATRLKERVRVRSRLALPQLSHCEQCGATGKLHRHHPDHVNAPDNVVVLCASCHRRAHAGTRQNTVPLPMPVVASEYLKATEAAAYLRFPSYASFRTFRSRHGIPKGTKFGRRVLFTREQLDEAVAGMAATVVEPPAPAPTPVPKLTEAAPQKRTIKVR